MKVIDFRAVKKICESISYETYYEWIEDALKNKDGFVVPVKSKISQANGDYYGIMPCMYEKDNLAMVKMIGRHTLKKGELRSTMMGDLLLYEADTGVLKAVMDGEYITTLRTGAAAAQAAMMYGKKDFSVIGLIGLGNIMTVCMFVLLSIRKKEKLTVKLYQYHNQELRFMERFSQYDNIDFVLCDSYKDTIKGSEVIISAVTNVKEDFCPNNCYDEGCTVIPVMMRGFQNCDLFFDKIYTDEVDQIRGFKYFNQFKAIANTTDVIRGERAGRESDAERILVYYYGLAIHDLYFASHIYNMADESFDFNYNYCREKYFF